MLEFILPFPPSVNSKYNITKGRRSKGEKVLQWTDVAATALRQQRIQPVTHRVVILYELFTPDYKERDAPNYEKFTTDFLVDYGILKGDSRRYVKGVYSFWNDIDGKAVNVKLIPAELFKFSYAVL